MPATLRGRDAARTDRARLARGRRRRSGPARGGGRADREPPRRVARDGATGNKRRSVARDRRNRRTAAPGRRRVGELPPSAWSPHRLVVARPRGRRSSTGAEVAEAAATPRRAMRRRSRASHALPGLRGGGAHRVDQHRSAVDAAVAAGVERIVYTSFFGAARRLRLHASAATTSHTEQHIKATPLAWTFLRDNIYVDYVPFFAGEDGVIRGPAGDGRLAAVARDDIAAVARAVLTRGPRRRTYAMTGPEAFTLGEAASAIGRTPVVRSPTHETIDEAWASRAPSGAPAWEIEGWVTTYTAIAAGELEAVSGDVERPLHRSQADHAWTSSLEGQPRELPAPRQRLGAARSAVSLASEAGSRNALLSSGRTPSSPWLLPARAGAARRCAGQPAGTFELGLAAERPRRAGGRSRPGRRAARGPAPAVQLGLDQLGVHAVAGGEEAVLREHLLRHRPFAGGPVARPRRGRCDWTRAAIAAVSASSSGRP